jgi:alkylation response protein AidB-like acyl-CoA dehydrogenase
MDFDDTPQEAEFRTEVRTWLDANAPKHLLPWLENATFASLDLGPHDAAKEAKAWRMKKFDAGWSCLSWPKEYGGRDASPIERVIWGQEEGAYGALGGLFGIGEGMCGPTVMAFTTEDKKLRYLNKLASGEEVWCQLFSEPASGSDLAGLRTRAVKDGDTWVINGQKIWTSGAHYSDYGILLTRTDPDVAKHKGLTMFILDMKAPGVEIKPIKQVNGQSGFNEVFFTDVRIKDAERLGDVGQGWTVALTTLMNERMSIGGSMPTGFPEMLELVKGLEGMDGPMIKDRNVRDKLADWHCQAAGLKHTSSRMLSAISRGDLPGPEASIGKLVAGSMMQEMAMAALDLQDLSGAILDPDLAALNGKFQAMLLRSPATRVEGGTDEILRNIISERVLGLPGDVRVDKKVAFRDIPKGI